MTENSPGQPQSASVAPRELCTRKGRIPVKPYYTPADLDEIGFDYEKDVAVPGRYPYTRGNSPLMYCGEPWIMAQVSGFGTAPDANKRWRLLLERGLSGLLLVSDLPTQIGLDADHPLSKGNVGRVGVCLNTLVDMEEALDLPFDKVRLLNFISSSQAPVIFAMAIVALEKKKISPDSFILAMQNEPLKEFICRGLFIFPIEPAMRLAADVIEYCVKHYPNWVPINPSEAHMTDTLATPAQGVGFSFSNAIAYIDEALKRGLTIDQIASSIWFVKTTGPDFFEEASQIRAMRRLWAKLMKDRYGAKEEKAMMLRFILQTAGVFLAKQQPLNNIVRISLQAMGGILGGAEQVGTANYDEALAIPTEEATRVTLATHYMLAEEASLSNVVDPLAGSYYVEYLTKTIENEAAAIIKKVDELGGSVEAIKKRYFQEELESNVWRWQSGVEEGRILLAGVNKLRTDKEAAIHTFKYDRTIEGRQIERLNKVRKERDGKKVEIALKELDEAARGTENLMPPIIAAVRAYATLGEICGTLRGVFGEYKDYT